MRCVTQVSKSGDNIDMKKLKYYFIVSFFAIISFSSCSEIKTNDVNKVYQYWAGTKPTSDVELIQGRYWQSAHWTKEYIMYLELKSTKIWWDEFVKQNNLVEDENKWIKTEETPAWFNPSEDSKMYRLNTDFNESRCFYDEKTGLCFIYEIQL